MVFIADFIMLGDLMAAVCPVGDRRIMQILPDKNFKLYLHTKGDDFQHSLGCVKPSCPAGKDRCERKTGRCWRAARRRPGQGGEQVTCFLAVIFWVSVLSVAILDCIFFLAKIAWNGVMGTRMSLGIALGLFLLGCSTAAIFQKFNGNSP